MNPRLFLLLMPLLIIPFSCQKMETGTDGVSLPFDNYFFQMEDVNANLPSYCKDIWFSDENNGLLLTYFGKIYKTSDAGKNWDMVYSNTNTDFHLFKFYSYSASEFFALGGSASCNGTGCTAPGGLILKSTDFGLSWDTLFHAPGVEFVAMERNAKGELFAIGNNSNGHLYKTMNAQNDFQEIANYSRAYTDIKFQGQRGFLSTNDGDLFLSIDEGLTWNTLNGIQEDRISEIGFSSATGYLLGSSKRIRATKDAGNSWDPVFVSPHSIHHLFPIGDEICLTFGGGMFTSSGLQFGGITYTWDGWQNWEVLRFNELIDFSAGYFYSSRDAYMVSGNHLIKFHHNLQ